ncbi:MAG: hypothetical protein P1V19_05110, partial [Gimesia sp.]|nr:hypothetical protein [Gimesia sp.]
MPDTDNNSSKDLMGAAAISGSSAGSASQPSLGESTAGETNLTKSISGWMSYLRLVATNGFHWAIHHIKETSSVTWRHFRSLLDYGVALCELRSMRNAAVIVRLHVGQELHRLEQGDEKVRKQIDQLSDQLEKLRSDNKSTRKLEREKKNMFIQLASQSESTNVPSLQQADAAVEQHTIGLAARWTDLCSLTRQNKNHTVIGYTAVMFFLYLSANVLGGVIFPDEISGGQQQVALVDENDDDNPTSDQRASAPANLQDKLAQVSVESDPRNQSFKTNDTKRVAQKKKAPEAKTNS